MRGEGAGVEGGGGGGGSGRWSEMSVNISCKDICFEVLQTRLCERKKS